MESMGSEEPTNMVCPGSGEERGWGEGGGNPPIRWASAGEGGGKDKLSWEDSEPALLTDLALLALD